MNSKRLIIGNWKMNPITLVEARKIARRIKRVAPDLTKAEAVICPPSPFIAGCSPKKAIKNFHIGAQMVSYEESSGPFTGEVSAPMLRGLGCEYVIVGHSEQRKQGDTDAIVSKRMKAVLDAGMVAVVCVGEAARDEGGIYLEDLKNQVKNSFMDIPKKYVGDIVIAYEPIWAIGAKEAMPPEQVYEMSLFVKKVFSDVFGVDNGLKVKVLYGGSVNFRNAVLIITVGKVDGLLVGRESVNVSGFVELLKAVDAV
ncbi:MAG: triose-phosphate isomerase [Patescibacteria group bacterium]